MKPAARLQTAIEILAALETTSQPVERFLRDYFRTRRFAGSKDRRGIGDLVFHILRHRATLAWRMGDERARALGIAAALADGSDLAALFAGGYGPAPLTVAERAAIAHVPDTPPPWVRGEFPQFLEGELTRAFGDGLPGEMAAFLVRAPVDLRVNTLKAARDEVLFALRADGFACAPPDLPPAVKPGLVHAIRCAPGSAGLDRHPLFEAGAFEIQDAAAQIASALAGALPGMRVLDLAAGAGGKTLALASAMRNTGEIVACDIRPAALAELARRAARAGVSIVRTHLLGDMPAGPFDIVFVDAPCSGSGTWRRQPELKWRLTPARLEALRQAQDGLLARAASVRPGRLVYATCSILPCENQDRVAAFLEKSRGFRRQRADFHASPAATGTDGFYTALLDSI